MLFSYGVSKEKSSILYSVAKERIRNAFVSMFFKNHFREIIDEQQHCEEFSAVFYYLRSITDRKEKKNQFRDNVSFNPIDCGLDFLNSFSPNSEVTFQPQLLNSNNAEKRGPQIELLFKFFRHLVETSNANLIHNSDHLLAASKEKRDNITWVGPSKQCYNQSKFKLTY